MPAFRSRTADALEKLRNASPLVHNITNLVVMHTTANALAALGASPVMAHAAEEVADITAVADALVLNIGTLTPEWVRSMHIALETANAMELPVVIDPVGAGASSLRTRTALELLERSNRAVLRGNGSEIMTLAGASGNTKGVDSTKNAFDAREAALRLARKFGCIVCVSGVSDYITDGTGFVILTGGSAMMPRVVGLGCTASAVIGAFAGALGIEKRMEATACAMAAMAAAGKKAEGHARGPGSFFVEFLDALYTLSPSDLEAVASSELPA